MQPILQFIVYERSREQMRYPWRDERLVIGRRADADIRVNEPTMSSLHAELVADEDGIRVRDLDSLNGTQVNGSRVAEALLLPGDQIQIGRARIVLARAEGSGDGLAPPPLPSKTADRQRETGSPAGHEVRAHGHGSGSYRSGGYGSGSHRTVDPRSGGPSAEGGRPTAHASGEPTRTADAPRVSLLDEGAFQSSQTVKVRLDELRASQSEAVDEEDPRILLLVDLFESLKHADDRATVLSKTRAVLLQAFQRARVFVFTATEGGEGEDAWVDLDPPDRVRRPSLTVVDKASADASAMLSTSLPDDQRFSASESARISGIETAMAAPARCDGATVAVLYVDRLGLPPFHVPDLNLLGIAANHVSAVLENVARIDDLQRTNAELTGARERLAEMNRNLEFMVEDRTAEVRRQAEEIRLLAEAKDELLGIAAHDIRGPLTVIQGTTELLRLRADSVDPATLARSLELVHGASRGLSQLLSELLDAKAIESGKIRLERSCHPLAELFEMSLPVPRLAAETKRIHLVIDADETERIDADLPRLSQALTNLLLNAVKFSESGSSITLRARTVAGHLRIDVEDQGPGIHEDDLERIFGSFEQADAGRDYGGSGLGLMIARRLVELHDGALEVASQVGQGSRFTLSLPVSGRDARPEADASETDLHGPDPHSPDPSRPSDA